MVTAVSPDLTSIPSVMKYFGSTVDYTHHRNAEIMKSFRKVVASHPGLSPMDIAYRVSLSPSPRFWVSETRAAIVIGAMQSGRALPPMTDSKREMFMEIFRRYTILRKNAPDKPLIELVSAVVHQPAPRFYYTPRTIEEFIRRIRKGYYSSRQNRINPRS